MSALESSVKWQKILIGQFVDHLLDGFGAESRHVGMEDAALSAVDFDEFLEHGNGLFEVSFFVGGKEDEVKL